MHLLKRRKRKKDKPEEKEEEIEFKELEKGKAYAFKVGKTKFLSVKLPSSDLSEIVAEAGLNKVGGRKKKQEVKEWLTLVRGEDYVTRPYEVWAKLAAKGLSTSTSTKVTSSSVAVSTTAPPERWTKIRFCPECYRAFGVEHEQCPVCGAQLV